MAIAFDTSWGGGNFLAHLAGILLVASLFARSLRWVKTILLGVGIAGVIHALFVSGSATMLLWAGLLATISAVQLTQFLFQERAIRFSDEEKAMIAANFPTLDKGEARGLLDQGFWLSAKPGDRLTTAGTPISHLYYLASGSAGVMSGGKTIADVTPESFIGEVTALTGEPATVTVDIDAPSRLWCIPAEQLRRYVDENDTARRALEAAFRKALSEKLIASNRRALGEGAA